MKKILLSGFLVLCATSNLALAQDMDLDPNMDPTTAKAPAEAAPALVPELKSLSQEEIDGFMQGKPMDLARAAEVFHYPNPEYVLKWGEKLQLNSQQREHTKMIYLGLTSRAADLGAELLTQESLLEQDFAGQSVNLDTLHAQLAEIARLEAKIRGMHLSAYVMQRQLLSAEQFKLYQELLESSKP